MKRIAKKFVKDCLYGPTNTHFELARVLTTVFAICFIGLQGYFIFKGGDFTPMDFAMASGVFIAGAGAGIGIKDLVRPKALRDGETVAD